jgi:hypothetical protein
MQATENNIIRPLTVYKNETEIISGVHSLLFIDDKSNRYKINAPLIIYIICHPSTVNI